MKNPIKIPLNEGDKLNAVHPLIGLDEHDEKLKLQRS